MGSEEELIPSTMPSRAETVRIAHTIELDRARLERAGIQAVIGKGLDVQEAVIRAYEWMQTPGIAVYDLYTPYREAIVDYMVSADLMGRVRARQIAGRHKAGGVGGGMGLSTALWLGPTTVYNQVVQFATKRLGLSDQAVRELRDLYGSNAASVTGEIVGVLESKVQAAVSEALGKGLHVREGKKLIAEAFHAAGVVPANSYATENIFRTQTALAFNAGRMNQNRDPAIQEILWGYEYSTVGDDRVRPAHAAMDGVRAPKDDPLWRTWTPPCGHSCRCFVPGTKVAGSFIAGSKARYSGPVVELKTAGGRRLTVTVNHPIATTRGLVLAGDLREGDTTLCRPLAVDGLGLGRPDDQDGPSRIEDVFEAIGPHRARAHPGPLDFHGDAARFNGEVDVVWGDAKLRRGVDSHSLNALDDLAFMLANLARPRLPRLAALLLNVPTIANLRLPLHLLGIGRSANRSVRPRQSKPYHVAAHTQVYRNPILRHALEVLRHHLRIGGPLLDLVAAAGVESMLTQELDDRSDIDPVLRGDPLGVGIVPVHRQHDGSVGSQRLGRHLAANQTGTLEIGVRRHHRDPARVRRMLAGLPAGVEVDKLVAVKRFGYTGHVFDLQSSSGLLYAGDIVASNCTLIEIFNEDREASPTKIPTTTMDEYGNEIDVVPDAGWDFNPADLFAATLERV